MPNLEESVVEWSEDRPRWQQVAMRIIARSEPLDDHVVGILADHAAAEVSGVEVGIEAVEFLDGVESDSTVRLLGIGEPSGVNALDTSASLDFEADGLTIIYGDNASGKSGWARILKDATRARDSEPILSDVFESDQQVQRARITFSADEEEIDFDWPGDQGALLRSISFYDSACGTHYLTSDTEVAYRPVPLALLDRLALLCGEVRTELESRKRALESAAGPLPDVPAESPQEEFLERLSNNTSSVQLDDACAIPENAEEKMVELRKREAALLSSNPAQEHARLRALAESTPILVTCLQSTASRVSDDSARDLRQLLDSAVALREAAADAAAGRFGEELLAGVGSSRWKGLWEAARLYSSSVAYPDHGFPVVDVNGDPARCVLCFQRLDVEAQLRLTSFAAHVAEETESEARRVTEAASAALAEIADIEVQPAEVAAAMVRLHGEDPQLHAQIQVALKSLEDRKQAIVRAASDRLWEEVPDLVAANEEGLLALQNGLGQRVHDLDGADPIDALTAIRDEKRDLEGRRALGAARAQLTAEIARLQQIATTEAGIALTATQGITRKSVELTRLYVGADMQEQFRQEATALGLERVLLADVGGERGRLRHRAQLEGVQQDVELRSVLSEGEKTALGLAAFLTEVARDSSASGVVLDDPVSSMDHVHQERVALRLATLASERQVVVFTHAVSFVIDLKRAAEMSSVSVGDRWVFKTRDGVGNTRKGHPWRARVVPQRLNAMLQKLAEVRQADGGDPGRYDELVREWYSDLRDVWERMIEETLVGRVLDRGELQIRPLSARGLVQFDDTDLAELNAAFTRCGEMGSHDQSQYLNRATVRIEELEQDLDVARVWHQRVKDYFR